MSDVAKSKRGVKNLCDGGQFAALPKRALFDARLNKTHIRVLGIIALHDGRSGIKGGDGCWKSQRDMAFELRIAFGDFSGAVKDLLLWGYVRREQKPRDKRMWLYRVSYTGREIIEAATKLVRAVPNDLVSPGPNDLREKVSPGPNVSLGQSEKIGNGVNELTPLLDPTRSLKEQNQEGEASPLPCNSRASASQEKEKEASREEAGVTHLPNPQTPTPHEGPTQEERDRGLANWETVKRQLRKGSAK